jgi:hypothetical protein
MRKWRNGRTLDAVLTIKQRKMKYLGHIKRNKSLEKKIMEGYIPGRRKREVPKRVGCRISQTICK